jgi:hypothetical protein
VAREVLEAVMREQLEYLLEHARRSRSEREICAGGSEETCRECARFFRVRAELLSLFE